MTHSSAANLTLFESHRALLVAHAYRMLGDLGRAEDIVQESWLRWDGRQGGGGLSARLSGDTRHAPVLERARFGENPS